MNIEFIGAGEDSGNVAQEIVDLLNENEVRDCIYKLKDTEPCAVAGCVHTAIKTIKVAYTPPGQGEMVKDVSLCKYHLDDMEQPTLPKFSMAYHPCNIINKEE
jgi:hypothetical protein